MELWFKIVALFLSVVVGGLLVQIVKKKSHLKLILSFSGGFLLTIIFTHILPESYGHNGGFTGYFILLGFLLQLILEYFSKGAEHGHTHLNHKEGEDGHIQHFFPLAIFLSLSIHAFIEATPLDHSHHSHQEDLVWGVVLHKIPVAVALMSILMATGYSKVKSWVYLLLFALMAPVGILLGEPLMEMVDLNASYVLAVAVGMFLHISTTIIFESSEGHKLNALKLVAILLGFAAGMFMS